LRIACPEATSSVPSSVGGAKDAADRLAADNGEWEARLAAEQADVNRVQQRLIQAQARHDTLARWVGEARADVTALASAPTDHGLSVLEEGRIQVRALTGDNSTMEEALRAVFRSRAAAQTKTTLEALAMAPVAEVDRDPQSSSEKWRTPLRRELADAVEFTSLPEGLPPEVAEAARTVETAVDAEAARAAVDDALRVLEEARARSTAVTNCLASLTDLSTQAEAIQDYRVIELADRAREEFEGLRHSLDTTSLSQWARDRVREIRRSLDGARDARGDLEARLEAQRRETAALQAQDLFADVLRSLGWVEVQMETWRPRDGRLFREPGQAEYGKLIQVDEDGDLTPRPVRLGAASSAATRRQDSAECRRQVSVDNNRVLPAVEAMIRNRLSHLPPETLQAALESLGLADADGPMLSWDHRPPTVLGNVRLSQSQEAELRRQSEEERGVGGRAVEQVRSLD
jgi:hypothetical protein